MGEIRGRRAGEGVRRERVGGAEWGMGMGSVFKKLRREENVEVVGGSLKEVRRTGAGKS